jgi:hypothetical protein
VNPKVSIAADLKMYGRFACGLRNFLRHTINLEEARFIVQQRLMEREINFLRLITKGIYGYPRSPYLPLLKLAQVELGDIKTMVRDKGLENTLLALRGAGVYVSFEEFKGREPIVRDGKVIPVQIHDFDNPHLKQHYYRESGGTTGAGTRIPTDLDHLAAQAPDMMLAYEAHGLLGVPEVNWCSILPGPGVDAILRRACFGQVVQKWYSPIGIGGTRPALKYWLATYTAIVLGRLLGRPLPWPETARLDQAAVVARRMAETLGKYGECLLLTLVSWAVRVCLAAREEGLDLKGAVFWGGGEPPTPAKVRTITERGASWIAGYWFMEVGAVGLGCAQPADVNDNHLLNDSVAIVQYPRRINDSEITVDAFNFTTLLPTAPKILLNVESDDYGIIEKRSCGCMLESYGFTEHVRHIRSFSKLSGEGVSLVGSEMVQILEEVLPARFGGSPLDYQLQEEEDDQGFTRLSLLVSPKVDIPDEGKVVQTILETLGRSSVAADMARSIWSQAEILRVKRKEPVWTQRGKLMSLHGKRHSKDRQPS